MRGAPNKKTTNGLYDPGRQEGLSAIVLNVAAYRRLCISRRYISDMSMPQPITDYGPLP